MKNISKESENILTNITRFADEAHGTQMRKYTPQRYIVHPVEVMQICREVTARLPVLAAALLHDVLEDTTFTKENILQFLEQQMTAHDASNTLELVIELTDVYIKKDYPQLNRRTRKDKERERAAATSADAQTIKYADIISNSVDIVKHDTDFAPVYLREMKSLIRVMNKGDEVLRQKAEATVNECLEKIKK